MPKPKKRPLPRYQELADYCRRMVEDTGAMPSYSQIAEDLRFHDRSTVRNAVIRAEARGLLHRSGAWRGGRGRQTGQRIHLGPCPVIRALGEP